MFDVELRVEPRHANWRQGVVMIDDDVVADLYHNHPKLLGWFISSAKNMLFDSELVTVAVHVLVVAHLLPEYILLPFFLRTP